MGICRRRRRGKETERNNTTPKNAPPGRNLNLEATNIERPATNNQPIDSNLLKNATLSQVSHQRRIGLIDLSSCESGFYTPNNLLAYANQDSQSVASPHAPSLRLLFPLDSRPPDVNNALNSSPFFRRGRACGDSTAAIAKRPLLLGCDRVH